MSDSLAVAYNIKRNKRKGEMPAHDEKTITRKARLKEHLFAEGGMVESDPMDSEAELKEFMDQEPMAEVEMSQEEKRKERLRTILGEK
jgi:hypothetical protein